MCAFVASNTSSHISSVSSSVAVGVDATPRADHIKFWRPHHWRARTLDAATHHSCQCAPPLLSSVSWLSNWWTCCWRTTRRKSLTTRELPSFASRHLWCGAGRRFDLTIDDSDEDHRDEGDGNAALVRGAPCRCAVVSKCWASTPRRRGQGCWNNMTERYLSLSVSIGSHLLGHGLERLRVSGHDVNARISVSNPSLARVKPFTLCGLATISRERRSDWSKCVTSRFRPGLPTEEVASYVLFLSGTRARRTEPFATAHLL